jgi:hypothetical protein
VAFFVAFKYKITFKKKGMKKVLLLVMIFTSISLFTKAQTAEDSVKQVINNMFTAMRTSDAALFSSCFTDSALLQTIAIDRKTSERTVRNEDLKAFAEHISKLQKDSADERIAFETIKIDADLASVWTPYQFFYNNKFSHCGVNSFQLVRIKNAWKIQYIIDTRRRDNCGVK